MYSDVYLEYPFVLLLIVLFVVCEIFCKMRLPSIYFPHTKEFMRGNISKSKLLFILKYAGIVFLILALSSPVTDEPYQIKPKEGHEIVLVLDASQSMEEQGFDRSNIRERKFDVVKKIVADFVKKRENDNMGLIVFGAYSFVASPLTYDKNILSRVVMQLQIGMAGKYTALYEGLAQGVNLLKNTKSKSKVLILLTDGYSTNGIDKIPLDVAIDMAKKEGVKVYPIGIGTTRDYNANVLLKIAKETGGVAFGASSANELKAVYKQIDELEKSKIKAQTFSYKKYYYLYPLFLAFIALMLYVYLRNKRGVA